MKLNIVHKRRRVLRWESACAEFGKHLRTGHFFFFKSYVFHFLNRDGYTFAGMDKRQLRRRLKRIAKTGDR
jgi:hypothetical protein